ncbi:MAG: tyrosine-type recombinase/integrase [Planctomycetota bacterium]
MLPRADGGPFNKNAYTDRWNKLRAKATEMPTHKSGPELLLHDARHTHCTHMTAAGVPLYLVGNAIGQSAVSMTERYSHITPDGLKTVAEAATQVFGRAPKPKRAAK